MLGAKVRQVLKTDWPTLATELARFSAAAPQRPEDGGFALLVECQILEDVRPIGFAVVEPVERWLWSVSRVWARGTDPFALMIRWLAEQRDDECVRIVIPARDVIGGDVLRDFGFRLTAWDRECLPCGDERCTYLLGEPKWTCR